MSSSLRDAETSAGFQVPLQRVPERSSTTPPTPAAQAHPEPPLGRIALLSDTLTLVLAVSLATLGRNHLGFLPATSSSLGTLSTLTVVGPVMVLGWLAAIALCGGYQSSLFGSGSAEYRRLFTATLAATALLGLACYLCRFELSRGFLVLAAVFGFTLTSLARHLLRRLVMRLRVSGALLNDVLVVGAESHVDEVASVLKRETWLGYRVIGALTPSGLRRRTSGGIPILGSVPDVARVAASRDAGVVLFAGGGVSSASHLRELAWDLEGLGTHVVVAPSLTEVSPERVTVRPVGGVPLLHLETTRSAAATKKAKRVFDVIGAAVLLLCALPMIALAAWQIRRYDGGPVFFRQERIGRNGEPFRVWKFRTMVINAEQRLNAVLEEQGVTHGVFAKLKDDPRITPPGRWLRRLSLDELPQLLNVLSGDMSLVGPRPQVEDEVAHYDDVMSRRLRVRPGMTGLWQVSGRSDLSPEEAIRLDVYYVDNWSMLQDLSILARTFGAVVGSRGAY